MNDSNITQLVTTKPESEVAADLKARIVEALGPVTELDGRSRIAWLAGAMGRLESAATVFQASRRQSAAGAELLMTALKKAP